VALAMCEQKISPDETIPSPTSSSRMPRPGVAFQATGRDPVGGAGQNAQAAPAGAGRRGAVAAGAMSDVPRAVVHAPQHRRRQGQLPEARATVEVQPLVRPQLLVRVAHQHQDVETGLATPPAKVVAQAEQALVVAMKDAVELRDVLEISRFEVVTPSRVVFVPGDRVAPILRVPSRVDSLLGVLDHPRLGVLCGRRNAVGSRLGRVPPVRLEPTRSGLVRHASARRGPREGRLQAAF
jgi:hypothetical protein